MYAISWCRLLLYTFLHISISAQHYTMITRGGAVPILCVPCMWSCGETKSTWKGFVSSSQYKPYDTYTTHVLAFHTGLLLLLSSFNQPGCLIKHCIAWCFPITTNKHQTTSSQAHKLSVLWLTPAPIILISNERIEFGSQGEEAGISCFQSTNLSSGKKRNSFLADLLVARKQQWRTVATLWASFIYGISAGVPFMLRATPVTSKQGLAVFLLCLEQLE
jgi:hypothetical protein